MGFKVLLYHELIKKEDYKPAPVSAIHVKQAYEDCLPHKFFCYVEDFEEQMAYLHREGYHTLTLGEVQDYYDEHKPLPPKSVLLTFDDLFVSVHRYAYPVLKQYGFHAVGFAVREWLFDQEEAYSAEKVVCMSVDQAEAMKDVFEYANHTATMHTKKLLGPGQMITQIQETTQEAFAQDLKVCEEWVDYKGAFAYPFGGYHPDNVSWLEQLGYSLAFTAEPGVNDQQTHPLLLWRDAVVLGTTLTEFERLLIGGETK